MIAKTGEIHTSIKKGVPHLRLDLLGFAQLLQLIVTILKDK